MGGDYPTFGADILELHITLSKEMFGPDIVASVNTSELRSLVEGIRFIERACHFPVNKDGIAPEFDDIRKIFTKSIFSARDLPAGTCLQKADLVLKKPGTGISSANIDQLLGKCLAVDVKSGCMLHLKNFR